MAIQKMTRDDFVNNKEVDTKIILGVLRPCENGIRDEKNDEYVIVSSEATKANFEKMKKDNPEYYISSAKFNEDDIVYTTDLEDAIQKIEKGAKFNPELKKKAEEELRVEENTENIKKRRKSLRP